MRIKSLFGGLALVLVSGLLCRVKAQTFLALHSFSPSDGAPPTGLLVSNSTLYGAATWDGAGGYGTIFSVNTDGTGFTNFYNFTDMFAPFFTNSDGTLPEAGVILSGNTLYGTASQGGPSRSGTVFKVNTDGTGFTTLHGFTALNTIQTLPNGTNLDGAGPWCKLAISGSTLYGTTSGGGIWGNGTIFKVNTDGTGFTVMYTFSAATAYNSNYSPINSDGANPATGMILSDGYFYGTAQAGGSSGNGTVFSVTTDPVGETVFTVLHDFTASDANGPRAGLILSGNTLYGTTGGTVFALNTDGTGFTTLHGFTGGSDGANPTVGLILGNTLYGTAEFGGAFGQGTIFSVNTNGTGFTVLYNFTGYLDGGWPDAGLLSVSNTLYGGTQEGGSVVIGGTRVSGGTIFSLSFTPQLSIIPSGPYVILTWPTDYNGFSYAGYTLQSTTNLGSSAVWTTNSLPPVVIGGQKVVINPTSGRQQFFRLSQ